MSGCFRVGSARGRAQCVITDKYKEKAYATEDVGLSADAKTLTMTVHFTGRDKANVLVFDRQ